MSDNNIKINENDELWKFLNTDSKKRYKNKKIIAWKKEKRNKIGEEKYEKREEKINDNFIKWRILNYLEKEDREDSRRIYKEEARRNFYNTINIEKEVFYIALIYKKLKERNKSFKEIENILRNLNCNENQIKEGRILYETVLKFREK